MKVLFLSAGNSIHTVRWVNALSEKGCEVHLVYNSGHEPRKNAVDKRVIQHKLRYYGSLAYYLNHRQLNKIYKQLNPDIVNAHYASGYGTLARLAKIKPLLLSVWGSDVYDFPYANRWNMKLIKKNLFYANHIISTSHCMARQVERVMGRKCKISITPFGVDINQFCPHNNVKNNKKFIFGIVKALKEKYGIEYIIKAFSIVNDQIRKEGKQKDIVLHIYGEGECEGSLKKLCRQLNIREKVKFFGYVENSQVPFILNKMDVFCLGSIFDSESFGVAAVEAMSCGLPVIATAVDGFEEVVIDQQTGYIVPKCNPKAMSDKMYYLIKHPGARNKLGEEARKRVLKSYNWNRNVDTMLKIYYQWERRKFLK